ncbi:hypothetical protein [Streptomyces gobitricini]|uniref:DUF3592 domain-containing protein n=1 Tax=Streptomyces gobitricini TaxID=68211 RepID=A0ABP6AI23_9ACTN
MTEAVKNHAGRPALRNRTVMRRSAVPACLLLSAAAWLFAFPVREAYGERLAFEAAAVCAPGHRDGECLHTVEARVMNAEPVKDHVRTSRGWLYFTEADGTASRTRLHGSPEDRPSARAGQRVEVTYWRGQIRYVDFPAESARQYTAAKAGSGYAFSFTAGSLVGALGVACAWSWYWWARHSAVSLRANPWQVGVPFVGALCLGAVGAVAPWLADSPGKAFRLIGLGAPPILAGGGVAALVLRRRSRGGDTIAVTPRAPDGERVVGGRVWGEVPYAVDGAEWLVVGPGYVAATIDPTGAAYRRPVPDALIPLRVRPPYWTDREGVEYLGKEWILECEDGGGRVLFLTDKGDMPWLLGALRGRPGAGAPEGPCPLHERPSCGGRPRSCPRRAQPSGHLGG